VTLNGQIISRKTAAFRAVCRDRNVAEGVLVLAICGFMEADTRYLCGSRALLVHQLFLTFKRICAHNPMCFADFGLLLDCTLRRHRLHNNDVLGLAY